MVILHYLLILIFGFFAARSFDLMIIRGRYFRRLADENRIRRVRIVPARGRILDRQGFELARNTVVYRDQAGKKLSRQEALAREARGEVIKKDWQREYPLAQAAAHLTGYLTEATQEEINASQENCPIGLGDLVGRGGIEQEYDCQLRGRPGEELVEVDARGEVKRRLGQRPAQPGQDIRLTIDKNWQQAVGQVLSQAEKPDLSKAVVVLDPRTGQVLALASWPAFDPNSFTKFRREEQIQAWLNDPQLPFLNRVIGGAYHPGSVFKMITAIAGLEAGKIDAQTQVEDTGVIKIGQWQFGNWYWLEYGRKEGLVDLVKAIKRSNDIYFYKVGEWLGVEVLLDWAKRFGLGHLTGIDLPGEVSGLLPSPEWKEKTKGERWFLGNTYHLAIGQGDLTMTPLQVAVETAVIANGGKWCRPHLNLIQKPKTKNQRDGNQDCRELGIKREHLELVKQGMIEACSPGGTGFPFFNFKPQVACKTGTAEVGDGTDETHAWFTLFYPTDQPRVVITVLVERGGSGAYVAAPIARQLIETYQTY